jgi:hypothetical protein
MDAALGKPWRVLSTQQLADPDFLPGHQSWRVPLPDPIELPHQELPVDPYVLGVLLGDGSYHQSTPRLSSADPELVEAVATATGLPSQHIGEYNYSFRDPSQPRNAPNPLMVALRQVGVSGKRTADKAIPNKYLWASKEQRLALLQGLLDTDGTVRKGHPSFDSTSPDLANGIAHLARSLGGVAKVSRQESQFNGRRYQDSYRVYIRLPAGVRPFRLSRKLERVKVARTLARIVRTIEPDGVAECVCIRVAATDSLYVTNDFIVTHNTFVLACIVFWALATHEDAIVISAAPKQDQLLLNVWKEIGRMWPRFKRHFPEAELTTGKIRMKAADGEKETWAATAFVAGVGADEEVAQKAAGFHAAYMLWITEETPGMHPAIMNTISNTRTGARNPHLAVGNPDHQHDPLSKFCGDPWVKALRISALDHPNVVTGDELIPGAVSRQSVERRTLKYGKGSRLYLSRIRGIAPAEAESALIRWAWCVEAATKYNDPEYRKGLAALGVDVANSETGDKAAIARWQGACLTEVPAFPCPDANLLGKMVGAEMEEEKIDGRYVGVDSVGVGAGTVNELKRLGKKVRWISSGTKAIPGLDVDTLWSETEVDLEGSVKPAGPTVIEAERFDNLRSQLWWRIREDLRMGRIALPDDEELFQDLTASTWTQKNGVICVESKKDIKKRIGHSPNKGDAAAYGNWVRRRRPERKGSKPDLRTTETRDYGLERSLARHEKARLAEKRQILRELKRQARKRKRA